MEHKEQFTKLLSEIENDSSVKESVKDWGVALLKKLIRGTEIVNREYDYYDNGYYLGYLMIAAQRIENTLVGLIESLEKLQAQEEVREVKMPKLNRPLGCLTDILEKYIESEIIKELRDFTEFRNEIVHKIYIVQSTSLSEIENSIPRSYDQAKILALQTKIMKLQALVLKKIHTDSEVYIDAIEAKIDEELTDQVSLKLK